MSNTAIMNPAAPVIAMNRPVMIKDIAEKVNMSHNTVKQYLNPGYKWSGKGVQLVRKTAAEMGYDPKAALAYTGSLTKGKKRKDRAYTEAVCQCGKAFFRKSANNKMCPECRSARTKELYKVYAKIYHGRSMNYCNGNFKTHEEEIARMQELRNMGYSNEEIAKSIGRTGNTVRCNIGKQDPELSKQNRVMANHIRAQKNAARRLYVLNKPIREYNKRVEVHNKMKAEIAKMEAELQPQTPAIEKAAQIKIDFPLVNLATLKPTALQ